MQSKDKAQEPRKRLARLGTLIANLSTKSLSDADRVSDRNYPGSPAHVDTSESFAVVPYCKLQHLPIEILHLINSHMDEVSTICLNNTSRYFYHNVAATPPSE